MVTVAATSQGGFREVTNVPTTGGYTQTTRTYSSGGGGRQSGYSEVSQSFQTPSPKPVTPIPTIKETTPIPTPTATTTSTGGLSIQGGIKSPTQNLTAQEQYRLDAIKSAEAAYIKAGLTPTDYGSYKKTFTDLPLNSLNKNTSSINSKNTITDYRELGNSNVVSAYEKPAPSLTNLFGLKTAIEERQNILVTQSERNYNKQSSFLTGAEQFGLGVISGGLGIVSSGLNIIFHPIKTGEAIGSALINPIGTATTIQKNIATGFRLNPSGTIGETIGTFGATKLIGGLGKVSDIKNQPLTRTEIIGVSQNIGENKLVTGIAYKTIGKETRVGVAQTITEVKDLGTLQTGKSITAGVSYKTALEFPTGRNILLSPKKFGAGSLDLSKSSDISVYNAKLKEGFIEDISSPIPMKASADISVGKVATASKSDYFAGVGGSYGNERVTSIFGSTGTVRNGELSNIGVYKGTIIRNIKNPSEDITSFKGGGTNSGINKLFTSEIQKTAQSVSAAESITKTTSPFKITGFVSAAQVSTPTLVETNYPSYVGGTQVNTRELYNFNTPMASLSSGQETGQRTNLINLNFPSVSLGQGGSTRFNERQIPFQVQVPGQIQTPKEDIRQEYIQRGVTTNVPNFAPRLNIPPTSPTPIIPGIPKFSFEGGIGGRGFGAKGRAKYTPSYESLLFNIKGKQPKGTETGIRNRPITNEFQKTGWAYSLGNLFNRNKKNKRRK